MFDDIGYIDNGFYFLGRSQLLAHNTKVTTIAEMAE